MPLYIVLYSGYMEVVKLLLEKGADITIISNNRWILLNLILSYSYIKVVKLLIEIPNINTSKIDYLN
jgi:ankyrin repeat protein